MSEKRMITREELQTHNEQLIEQVAKLHAANDHLSMVDHRAIGDIMLENKSLKALLAIASEGLEWHASWSEGMEVNATFDAPWCATHARATLARIKDV